MVRVHLLLGKKLLILAGPIALIRIIGLILILRLIILRYLQKSLSLEVYSNKSAGSTKGNSLTIRKIRLWFQMRRLKGKSMCMTLQPRKALLSKRKVIGSLRHSKLRTPRPRRWQGLSLTFAFQVAARKSLNTKTMALAKEQRHQASNLLSFSRKERIVLRTKELMSRVFLSSSITYMRRII